MKALKIIGIIVASLLIILLGLVLFLPPHAHVERSIVISSQPERIMSVVNNFKTFNEWSPWADLDPKTKYEFSGPEEGVGASMTWSSENKNVGAGSQTIIESDIRHIKNELIFTGYEGKSYGEFILEQEGGGTKVTWTYDGDMAGIGKIIGLFMDKMLGPSYEKGLQKLKIVVENLPAEKPSETVGVDTSMTAE